MYVLYYVSFYPVLQEQYDRESFKLSTEDTR